MAHETRSNLTQDMNVFFDLSDENLFINFHNHIEANPGFRQMIHLQKEQQGMKQNIRIDLSNRFNQISLKQNQLKKIIQEMIIKPQ